MRNLIFFFLSLYFTIGIDTSFGQNSEDHYKILYESALKKYSDDNQRLVEFGDSLYHISKTDHQKIYSLLTSAIGEFYLGKHDEVIRKGILADSLAQKLGNNEEEIRTSILLSSVYFKLSLIPKLEEQQKRLTILLSERKVKDKLYVNSLYNSYIYSAMQANKNKDYTLAKDYLYKSVEVFERYKINEVHYAHALYTLGNYLVELKDIEEGKKILNKTLEVNQNSSVYNAYISTMVNQELGRLAMNDKEFDLAYTYLISAKEIAKKNGYEIALEKINENLKEYYSQAKKYDKEVEISNEIIETKQVNDLVKNNVLETIIEHDNKEVGKIVDNKNRGIYSLISIITLLVLLLLGVFLNARKKKKNLEKYYEDIIYKINNSVERHKSTKAESRDHDIENDSIMISEEVESEILQKLQIFEIESQFIDSKLSISSMATLLSTNTKYLSYVLKKHRGKKFNDYLNGIRINYISKRLYEEPELLKYKITYISELAGFSSHSRFAQVFKKETNLSPLEFIALLRKDSQKNKKTGII